MSWENVNGRQCYYIITCVDGKLIRRYGGYGDKGKRAEAEVLRQQAELRKIRREGREQQSLGAQYEKVVNRFVAQSLIGLGYHLSYGRWRVRGRLRGRPSCRNQRFMNSSNQLPAPVAPIHDGGDEIKSEIYHRALATFAPDKIKLQSILDTLDRMHVELLSENAGRLEKVAVDQILTAWLQTNVTAYHLEGVIPNGRNARLSAFWENRHHKAQGRLLRAMELLARLKKLNLPSGDSNILKIVVERAEWPMN